MLLRLALNSGSNSVVECNLAKVDVAGSTPVSRSIMEWAIIFKYILVGLSAGVASGFFGIGGGLVMVPALVFFFGYSQHMAQGTSLAVLTLPIGLLAALRYHQSSNVNISAALWIALGLVLGAWVGAQIVHFISESVLKKIVGILFLVVAFKYLFTK